MHLLDQKCNSWAVMWGDRQKDTSPSRPDALLLPHPVMESATEVLPEIEASADSFCPVP